MADLDNIQAFIVRSSAKPLIATLLFRLGDAEAARGFLRDWSPMVPRGTTSERTGEPALHLLFSWTGLEKLLRGHSRLDVEQGRLAFEPFFVDPTQAPDDPAMAKQLGLLGPSAPEHWWDRRFTSKDIEVAVHASFDSADQKARVLDDLRTSAARQGLEELKLPTFENGALEGCRPADGRLHFGYRDGITTPDVDWTDSGRPGAVDLREFVVGYPNDDYPTAPQHPGVWQDFARDGSHVALAWIYQDVAAFNGFLKDNGPKAAPLAAPDQASEWLAAKLMGRWRDGTPLAKFPDGRPPHPVLDNDFGYADDPKGIKCPITAHIRVANGRDQPLKFANTVRFPRGTPRLIRRGFSYGPALTQAANDDVDRGVVGVFCFARVNEQFYTVLRWLQKTDFSDAFRSIPNGLNAQDGLFGNRGFEQANTSFHLPRADGSSVSLQLRDFIRYKGVAVFFAPSMAGLATLSAG